MYFLTHHRGIHIRNVPRNNQSGGPAVNGQGMFIGITTLADDQTHVDLVPARTVEALLQTLRARWTFKIKNVTGVRVNYEIRYSLETRRVRTHGWDGENVPKGYPRIRFDFLAGDQQITYRYYKLETAVQFQGNHALEIPTYSFAFNRRENRLDLFRAAAAAPPHPAVPRKVKITTWGSLKSRLAEVR